MKTYRNLYLTICDFNNLYAAYIKARRGKRYQPEVLRFSSRLEENLLSLQRELAGHTYQTGTYRRFVVYEPKQRQVAALPFRDRVVHHALCLVLEPIWEARFTRDSYACRVGKGTHAAANRLTEFLRRAHRTWGKCYVLKADVASYFASVDHRVLTNIIQHRVSCPDTLWLIGEILSSWNADAGRGIPIGNLTSQLFANIYLNELDQFIKHQLRAPYYVRYMDDLVLLAPDKATLWSWRDQIQRFLQDVLRLQLNHKTTIFPEACGVSFIGYRIWRTHRLLAKRNAKHMRRRLRSYARRYDHGEIDLATIRASIVGWVGHARHANTYSLRSRLLGQFTLKSPRRLTMATQRAIRTWRRWQKLDAQIDNEVNRLADTIRSLLAFSNQVQEDLDVSVADEVLIEEATGGETQARLAWPPTKDLLVKVNGQAISASLDTSGAVVTFAALQAGDVVTASYTHIGLRSELQELAASMPDIRLGQLKNRLVERQQLLEQLS